MNEDMKQLFEMLNKCVKTKNCNLKIDGLSSKIIIDYINELQQENAQYKEKFDSMDNSRKILYKIALPLKLKSEKIDNMPTYFELYEENQKLKQWDVNKDTRNSRQRVENAKLIKENTQLKQQVDECKEFATTYERELLAIIKCKGIEITKLQEQLKDKDEKISKVLAAAKNCNEEEYGADYFILRSYCEGIDELIEKYEDETLLLHKDTNCHDYGYYLALNILIQDLKKLKGE